MDIVDTIRAFQGGDEGEQEFAILLYVDSDDFHSEGGRYGTSSLQSALRDAGFEVGLHVHGQSPKLSADVLKPYQEVWFILLQNRDEQGLDGEEIGALRAWMDGGGGVLLTGDHAVGQTKPLEGLGQTVGRCVPRARHLRAWDRPGKSASQEPHDSRTLYGEAADRDASPQRLLVQHPRHVLFMPLRPYYLPDHPHEGVVVAPSLSGAEQREWRAEGASGEGELPAPRVIAKGVDWSSGDTFGLMAEWDGDAVGVGRILADASWHHYSDSNLARICAPIARRSSTSTGNRRGGCSPRRRVAEL